MATVLLPENGSTARGAVTVEQDNTGSPRLKAGFLPARPTQFKAFEGSEQQRPRSQSDDTTRNALQKASAAPLVRFLGAVPLVPRKIQILAQSEGIVTELSQGEFTAE